MPDDILNKDTTTPESFKEFMQMYQQAQRPNALEAIGSSMAGFAAPFLGQQWSNPYARGRGQGGGMGDMMNMLMMQQMMGNGRAKPAPVVPGTGVPPEGGVPPLEGMPEPFYSPLEGTMAGKMVGEDPRSKMARDVYQKAQEGKIGAENQAQAQGMKMAEQTSRDYYRTTGALDTTFDAALQFSDEQYKKWGLKPGDFLGLADRLTPSQLNEFKDAYTGSTREAAALVARLIIPQSRAIQMVDVFSKSVSKIGSTMEANAQNIAFSMQNGLSNAIANNMTVTDDNGQKVNIQDTLIDKRTGKALSQLGAEDKRRAINEMKRDFGQELSTFYLAQAYVKNPKLLQKKSIAELRSKAVKFNNIEEMEKSNVKPGFPVLINGRLGVRQ